MSTNRNLQQVIVPSELVEDFIRRAEPNTSRKVETCAILAGNMRNDSYIVDTLIIPKQKGETDHCYMEDEFEMFETQMKHQVMTIGWIHTHPQFVNPLIVLTPIRTSF
jgi:STAM-binding protein